MELGGVEEDIELTWNKTERELKTAGLRDGLSDGKDSMFQTSFDNGYQGGFSTGFAIGKYVAALQFSSIMDVNKAEPLLSNPKQGWCQLCPEPDTTVTLPEVVRKQLDVVNSNLQTLFSLYSEKINVPLPDSLDCKCLI